MDDAISSAADNLRAQIQAKVDQVKSDPVMAELIKLQTALNALEAVLGRPATSLAQFFALESGGTPTMTTAIAPDEFVNLPMLDAAKRFLRKVGKPARPFGDVVRGVRAGGGLVNYEDKLKIQLVRSNDVKKVGEDLFGLADWYPARKGRPPADGARTTRAASLSEFTDEEGPKGDENENASPEGEAT